MGNLKTIARRTFLIGSTAIIGGVAFGVYRYKTPYANPLLNDLSEGEAALTPYVRIDASGITLITPRAESGQGAHSVQAALIAEELDVELDQVDVDPGMPDKAYYNTALGADGAPFAATDDSFMANSTRTVMDSFMKFETTKIFTNACGPCIGQWDREGANKKERNTTSLVAYSDCSNCYWRSWKTLVDQHRS